MNRQNRIISLNIIFVLAFLSDRWLKWLAVTFWNKGNFFVWGSFWETKLFKNYHLSFSLPVSYPDNLLIILPILLVVIYFLIRAYQKNNIRLIGAFSLITLGAMSNLLDRLRYGFVIDFINWHFGSGSYPAFNLADVYIILGVIILIFDCLSLKSKHGNQPN